MFLEGLVCWGVVLGIAGALSILLVRAVALTLEEERRRTARYEQSLRARHAKTHTSYYAALTRLRDLRASPGQSTGLQHFMETAQDAGRVAVEVSGHAVALLHAELQQYLAKRKRKGDRSEY